MLYRNFLIFFIIFFNYTNSYGFERLLGVGTHTAQGKTPVAEAFLFFKVSGLSSYRDEIYWDQVEIGPENFIISRSQVDSDLLFRGGRSKGYFPLLVLGYGHGNYGGGLPLSDSAAVGYARYCGFVSRHYSGLVSYYEIWNEWNAGMGSNPQQVKKGSAEGYRRIVEKCAIEIRKNDPSAKILIGATAGVDLAWTDAVLKNGSLDFADGFSVHPYVFEHTLKEPEIAVNALRLLAERLSGFKDKGIYITEMGWPTSSDKYGVSEELSAAYMAIFLLDVMTLPTVRGVWIYELLDGGRNSASKEDRFGMVRTDRSVKPSFKVIQRLGELFRLGTVLKVSMASPGVKRVDFQINSGKRLTAFWRVKNPMKLLFGNDVILLRAPTGKWNQILGPDSLSFPYPLAELGPMPLVIEHEDESMVVIKAAQ